MRRWFGAFAVIVLAFTACGAGTEPDAAPRTPSEVASPQPPDDPYLRAVFEIESVRSAQIFRAFRAIEGVYGARELLFAAVADAFDPEGIASAVDAAQQLVPSAEHREDHARWLGDLQGFVADARAIQARMEDQDLLAVALLFAGAQVRFGDVVEASSPAFCRAVVQRFGGGADVICARDGGDPYETRLHAALTPLVTDVDPRIVLLIPSYAEEELLAYLRAIQPPVERAFAEMLAAVRVLDPPELFKADHAAIERFLVDIADVSTRITVAANDGDADAIGPLADEANRVYDRVARSLSAEARALIGGLFENAA